MNSNVYLFLPLFLIRTLYLYITQAMLIFNKLFSNTLKHALLTNCFLGWFWGRKTYFFQLSVMQQTGWNLNKIFNQNRIMVTVGYLVQRETLHQSRFCLPFWARQKSVLYLGLKYRQFCSHRPLIWCGLIVWHSFEFRVVNIRLMVVFYF